VQKDNTQRSLSVWVLVILQFFLGFGAALGGGLLILAPDGHLMQMPLDMIRNTPFSTFLIPGILLFTFVGIYPLVVAYCLFKRPSWSLPDLVNPFKKMYFAWAASLLAGVVVIIWICVQMIMIRDISFLHIIYIIWGLAIILLTLSPGMHRIYLK
jgi:hypothetical protein